ncbi:glycoside hydrolase family 92 protein [Mucilaginibacter hurinus]|uniref:Glycoside hydrolase family 92 protein n=1 Tax=Mucilaginibacter hurinus TaxID=2201324 RepID=A0A367GRR8_9SPHI|nr:GH92 family glycosyl hydrolase [Mucilaginibacter hurinus]RCH55788.1 glycoside hydrolase family 92 protein [Mucilaginibacter hurinus]
MKKKFSLIALSACILLSACNTENKDGETAVTEQEKQPVDYINPFIGASTKAGENQTEFFPGKTFPGAASPFGLAQFSPNTVTGGDNASGYSYENTSIEGFSVMHLSGTGWYGELGNFLVMPTTGPMKTVAGRLGKEAEGWRSEYKKENEKATAGYYSVLLDKYNVKAEMTVAPHSGIMRFTFPENKQSRIQIDLARRIAGTSVLQNVKVLNDSTIQGWMKCTPQGGGFGNGEANNPYTVYFYAKFSKPLKDFGVWSADIPDGWVRKRDEVVSDKYVQQVAKAAVLKGVTEKEGKHLGFYTEFATKANEQVYLKIGVSFVNIEGATANLNSEITGWDFDKVHRDVRKSWNNELSKMLVEGGTDEEKTVFYTGLYHAMLDPRSVVDVNGNYNGGDGKIHKATTFTKRSTFSGWDVFRSQFPLQSIINPTIVNDEINSLVELADENGKQYLERWEILNAYTGCMLGNPAVNVIADAYAKGIRDYDVQKAYKFAVNTCERSGNGEKGFAVYCDPKDEAIGYAGSPFSISNTLEFAYSEWCLAQLAKALGKKDDEAKYMKRSKSYVNIWDKESGWFRPKNEDGTWEALPKEGRLKHFYGTVESNPYQQGWFVPHDIPGMVAMMGGKEKTLADLTQFFEKAPADFIWNDYYNHANEPVHHVPFLFNRLGSPWLTQKWTREICKRAYHNKVYGLVGNEDLGQMSAWYILAASGFHPISPGDNRYELTSPVFSKITIKLDPKFATGKTFTVVANNNSDKNVYIQSAKLNGKVYTHSFINHADIIAGGTLELEMGDKPNENWGIN